MSRLMLTVALVLGSVTLVGGSARAETVCLGCFTTEAAAEEVGNIELHNFPGARYSIKYFSEDPRDGSPNEGYYLLVAYPGQAPFYLTPPPPPLEGDYSGILHPGDEIPIGDNVHVPYPGDPEPDEPGVTDPGPDEPGPDDDGGM
jgi:hypothetical protein